MMDLEQLERAMLEGARKELSPSASDRMRIRSHLLGNTAWFQPAPVRRSLLRGLTRSWRGGLALGFAVGALLGFGVSHGVSLALQRAGTLDGTSGSSAAEKLAPALAAAPPAAQAAGDTTAPGDTATPGDTAALAESASAAEAGALDRHADAARHQESSSARRSSARGAQERSKAEESGSTLAQELALLQRARRALNRNEGLLALGIVQSLDERFPDGVLMEERAATRILSLCQLGRNDEAMEQGHHFLLAHPRSVYAERVRHSCVGGR